MIRFTVKKLIKMLQKLIVEAESQSCKYIFSHRNYSKDYQNPKQKQMFINHKIFIYDI